MKENNIMSRHFKVGDIVQYVLGPRQPGETITYEVTYEVSHVNSDTGLIKLKGYSSWTQPRYYRLVSSGNSEVAEAKRLLESMGYTIDRLPFNGKVDLTSDLKVVVHADRKIIAIRSAIGSSAIYFYEFDKIAEVVQAAKKYNEES